MPCQSAYWNRKYTCETGTRNAMPVSLLKQKIDMRKGATQNAMPVSLLKQKIYMWNGHTECYASQLTETENRHEERGNTECHASQLTETENRHVKQAHWMPCQSAYWNRKYTWGTCTLNAMPVSLLKQKIDMRKGATQNAMPVSLLEQKIDMRNMHIECLASQLTETENIHEEHAHWMPCQSAYWNRKYTCETGTQNVMPVSLLKQTRANSIIAHRHYWTVVIFSAIIELVWKLVISNSRGRFKCWPVKL